MAQTKKEEEEILRLAEMGYDAQWGSQGKEALAKFRAHVKGLKEDETEEPKK